MSRAPRLALDADVRVGDRGRLLVGGMPARLVRLSDAGAAALETILDGGLLGRSAAALAERLEADGLLHPLPGDGAGDPPVTTIMPVLDGGESIGSLVSTLTEGPAIVVDDGSTDGTPERAAAAGARVITNDGRHGPAGARNSGLRAAGTELVAADPTLALVAPRVRDAATASAIGRYEAADCPLDLGAAASLVGPRHRVAYLPATALVGRREALLELSGFEEALRFGEASISSGASSLPACACATSPLARSATSPARRSPGSSGSGSVTGSAPELVARHGAAAAPLQAGRHTAAIWLVMLALGPRAPAPALLASTAAIAARGSDPASRAALAAAAVRGNARATHHLGRALVREWLPLSLAAALSGCRGRRTLLAALALDLAPVWRDADSPRDLPAITALHLLDRASYAAGMWQAMARRPDFRALLPRPAGG